MDITLTCPLGSQCEEIKNNKLHRCRWYIEMKGRDASGDEHNKWDCSITWLPILQVEVASTNRGTTHALESMRNETIKRQDYALMQIEGSKRASIENK